MSDVVSNVVVSLLLDTAYICSSLLLLILALLFAADTDGMYAITVAVP